LIRNFGKVFWIGMNWIDKKECNICKWEWKSICKNNLKNLERYKRRLNKESKGKWSRKKLQLPIEKKNDQDKYKLTLNLFEKNLDISKKNVIISTNLVFLHRTFRPSPGWF